jgi:signal transduction histidine kinase
MNRRITLPTLSLRVKLMLSYLAVALGAILILAIVVSLETQNYFITSQQDQLRKEAEYNAQDIGHLYSADGGDWSNVPLHFEINGPVLLFIVNANGQPVYASQPRFLAPFDSNDPVLSTLTQTLNQALQGQEVQGYYQRSASSSNSREFAGPYIGVPLRYDGSPNGQIIGAMLVAIPEQSFSPNDFLANVNQTILLAGAIIALIAIFISLLLVRSLTRPLKSLTEAAEQMAKGNYAQRVAPPQSQDEMGRLAVTFNIMADTIESDVNELRLQEQLRRDLIANIAHDLATPLTAIQGFSEALADNVISDDNARQETAQLIGREVQRLRRLVGDVQQMTSLESGRVQLDLAPLDLHSLIDETLAVIGPECEQAGITLENRISPDTPLVLADSDRITQVLLNLLDNARRYTPRGGRIAVEAKPAGNMLSISVSDTGQGINPEDLPHIFERFFKIDRARTGSASGSGLGLSIVKAIITAHGGTISAESKPGEGTRILFSLPFARDTHTAVVTTPASSSSFVTPAP